MIRSVSSHPLFARQRLLVGCSSSQSAVVSPYFLSWRQSPLVKKNSENPRSLSSTTTSNNSVIKKGMIRGEILNLSADLHSLRPGDRLDIPYELTVSEAMHDFWQSAFYSQDRIQSSRTFCRKLGLQDRVLPFSMALFLASSMSHADAAKVQVGFGKVSYLWPIFAGDTLTKSFTVKSIRNTSDGNHSIFDFTCDLMNQRGRLCMRADKNMLFEFAVPESHRKLQIPAPENPHLFRDHLLSKHPLLSSTELKSHSLAKLRPGQLILHSLHRSLSLTQSQQLASLARLTHARHFNIRKYDAGSEILIPGGLVLGIALSEAARDLHEVLHEEIQSVHYVNGLHPGNLMGAVSYIQAVDDNVPGDLEVLHVRTIGIKNMDVKRELDPWLPQELFVGNPLLPKDLEQVCKSKCPQLEKKIVVQVDRRILRQSSHATSFLL